MKDCMRAAIGLLILGCQAAPSSGSIPVSELGASPDHKRVRVSGYVSGGRGELGWRLYESKLHRCARVESGYVRLLPEECGNPGAASGGFRLLEGMRDRDARVAATHIRARNDSSPSAVCDVTGVQPVDLVREQALRGETPACRPLADRCTADTCRDVFGRSVMRKWPDALEAACRLPTEDRELHACGGSNWMILHGDDAGSTWYFDPTTLTLQRFTEWRAGAFERCFGASSPCKDPSCAEGVNCANALSGARPGTGPTR